MNGSEKGKNLLTFLLTIRRGRITIDLNHWKIVLSTKMRQLVRLVEYKECDGNVIMAS